MDKIPYFGPSAWAAVLSEIRQRAGEYDRSGDWPEQDIKALTAAGAMRWAISTEFGGDGLSALDLHLRYEELASASLCDALILTQRDSAVGLVESSPNFSKQRKMLKRFVEGSHFTTVGFAQLTTSHQHGKPALIAEPTNEGFLLNGIIPWCTGAAIAPFIVAGATLENREQILFMMEHQLAGVAIQPVMDLVTLGSSFTTSLKLKDVVIRKDWLMRGPAVNVLGNRHTSLPIGQAFLATGLTRSAVDLILKHDSELALEAGQKFERQLIALRDELIALSQPGNETTATAAAPRLRGACNELAIRVTQAAVAIYKGTALLRDHPAQRLAREAMFLLVWSCPNPVIDCTVDLLSK